MKQAVSSLSAAYPNPEDIPISHEEKYNFDGPSSFSTSILPVPLWHRIVDEHQAHLTELQQESGVSQALREDPLVSNHLDRMIGTPFFRIRLQSEQVLRAFLITFLQRQGALTFSDSAFSELYQQFDAYFQSQEIAYQAIAPIHGFTMAPDKLQISPGFAISRLSPDHRSNLMSRIFRFPHTSPPWQVPVPEFIFSLDMTLAKSFDETPQINIDAHPQSVIQSSLETALTALRLAAPGEAFCSYIYVSPVRWDPAASWFSFSPNPPPQLPGTNMTLQETEFAEFSRIHTALADPTIEKRRRFQLAIRRLNFTYARFRPEDRLIDCLIAFESLLLQASERQELEYRLSLRACALLGGDAAARRQLFNRLKAAYRERSAIVHGSAPHNTITVEGSPIPLHQFVDDVRQLLRSILTTFLPLLPTSSEDSIITNLDDSIISSGNTIGAA